MLRIISQEHILNQELEIILWLLDNGLDFYHIRKPKEDLKTIIDFLERIPFQYRKKVVLHHETSVLGFLKHHKQSEVVTEYINTHSCSNHSKDSVLRCLPYYEHLFWSPVFDSISKEGYKKNEDIILDSFTEDQKKKIIGLGGVEPNNFLKLKEMGFSQLAIKGWFWNRVSSYKNAWITIQTTWQELEKKY